MNITDFIKQLVKEPQHKSDNSVFVTDQVLIKRYIEEPDFPFLISFPRTGSHWLRMVMELYFERPSLVRSFYYHDRQDYLMLHTHDLELNIKRQNVIYLYRDPIATVYSQLNYYKEDPADRGRIVHWAGLYGRHLEKWLCTESFTTHKTVVTYEGMKQDAQREFQNITRHFKVPFEGAKLQRALSTVTKDEVKKKTRHDPQVIQLGSAYAESRNRFVEQQGRLVWETLLSHRSHLERFFPSGSAA